MQNLESAQPIPVAPTVADFLSGPLDLLIGDGWVSAQSGETREVINPSTGAVIATAALGGAADIDTAVRAARDAFDHGPWPQMAPGERRRLLLALADAIEREMHDFAMIDPLNVGMPVPDGYFVTAMAIESFRYNAGWTDKIGGDTFTVAVPDHHAYTLKEPIGVVGAIVPWNSPLMAAAGKLAPALAAGCTVVLKPSELSPLSAIKLGQLIQQVGFPAGVVNIVNGLGGVAGQALVDHPGVDKVTFTGSTAVGRTIVRSVAGTLKRVALELGGKSPVFIFADANIDQAIEAAAMGVFRNAGQICAAGSRVYVHKAVYDKVVAGVADRARSLKVGNALSPDVQMGPLVSQTQLERVLRYIDGGRSQGAEVVTGGSRIGTEGFFVPPTVLTNTNHDMTVVREEIFGPVVSMMPFDNDDIDVLAGIGNQSDYGLSAYIWTGSMSIAHKLAKKLRVGQVVINGGFPLDRAIPFGGYKNSGWGREYGREGVEAFMETKSVVAAL